MAISEQTAEASRRGGPLLPDDQGMQVAGKGDVIMQLFKWHLNFRLCAGASAQSTKERRLAMSVRKINRQEKRERLGISSTLLPGSNSSRQLPQQISDAETSLIDSARNGDGK